MRLNTIEIIKRIEGFFHYKNSKIRSYYPGKGYAVMCFLDHSPIDKDFKTNVWVPSAQDLQNIKLALEKSDRLTHQLLGKGWDYGVRPYLQLGDFL